VKLMCKVLAIVYFWLSAIVLDRCLWWTWISQTSNGAGSISSSVCRHLFRYCEYLSPSPNKSSYIEEELDGFAELCLAWAVGSGRTFWVKSRELWL